MKAFASQTQQIFAVSGLPVGARFVEIVNAACTVFDMDYGFVTRINEDGIEVVSATRQSVLFQNPTDHLVFNRRPGQMVSARQPDRSFSAVVAARKHPLLLNDVAQSDHLGALDLAGVEPVRFIGIPVWFDGMVFGTIELSGKASTRVFDPFDTAAAYFMSAALATPLALMAQH